jgi:hypothetical protein
LALASSAEEAQSLSKRDVATGPGAKSMNLLLSYM